MPTRDEILRIARLSRLELSDDEIPGLTDRLSAILDHVRRLDSVSTDGVEPMAHAAEAGNVLRDDEAAVSLPSSDALSNSGDTEGTHFRVPRTVK